MKSFLLMVWRCYDVRAIFSLLEQGMKGWMFLRIEEKILFGLIIPVLMIIDTISSWVVSESALNLRIKDRESLVHELWCWHLLH